MEWLREIRPHKLTRYHRLVSMRGEISINKQYEVFINSHHVVNTLRLFQLLLLWIQSSSLVSFASSSTHTLIRTHPHKLRRN